LAAKCKLVSKVSIETACQLPRTWGKDGVHYGTLVTSYGTVPEPQCDSWPDSSNWQLGMGV